MKADAPRHYKTTRLMEALDCDLPEAMGLLTMLCNHVAADFAEQGNVGRMTDREIARQLGTRRDPELVIEALVSCGWLERCDEYRLVIHDWRDHAEQRVKNKLSRQGLTIIPCPCRRNVRTECPNETSGRNARTKGSAPREARQGPAKAPTDPVRQNEEPRTPAKPSAKPDRPADADFQDTTPAAKLYGAGWGAGLTAVLMAEACADGRVFFAPDVAALFRSHGCAHPEDDFARWKLNRQAKGMRSADWLSDLEGWAHAHKAMPCPACVAAGRDGTTTASGMRVTAKTARTLAAAKRFAEREVG